MNRPGNALIGMALGLILATFAALWSFSVKAAFDTDNEFLRNCSIKGEFAGGLCYGLITGYYDGMRLAYPAYRPSAADAT